jgi:hypothetical protein
MEETLEDIQETSKLPVALGEKLGRLEHKIEITTKQTLNPAYYVRTRPWPTLEHLLFLGWIGRRFKTETKSNSPFRAAHFSWKCGAERSFWRCNPLGRRRRRF